jgi:type II secretory ATPase GspE/PulE/Tfp pilus assembly ATPase PilB-like protein
VLESLLFPMPATLLAQSTAPLMLGQGLILVGWWKAVLVLIPFCAWAWYVSKILDKHAQRFLLPREKFNTVHLVVGLVGILLAFGMPMKGELAFWIGLVLMMIVLFADIMIFINVHNKDERVPEKFRLNLVDFAKMQDAKDAKKAAALQGKAELVIRGPDKSVMTVPNADAPEFAVRVAAESLYIKAGIARAAQVELVPVAPASGQPVTQYRVQMLIDGVATPGDAMPIQEAAKIIDFWKTSAKIDLNERRKRISNDVMVERSDLRRKVRVMTQGSTLGMRLQLLFDPDKAVQRTLAELGLLDQQKADIVEMTKENKGLVLLAGPADQGRTTTFYSIIKLHDAYTSDVQTLELDPQMLLEGVKSTKYDQVADGPEFSTTMRSMLRRDPSVLAIAELPDANTAKEISKAEHERVRVYASIRADGAIAALQAWVKLVGDPEAAIKGLRAVVAQKLIRKLCTNCKVSYQPNADMLKKLGLTPDQVKQLYKKGGQVMVKDKTETCPQCGGGGYFGQEGIFEVYPLTDPDRQLIKRSDWNSLKLELRKRKLPTMQQAALRKAIDGVTSVEEVLRVTTEQQAAAAPAPASPAPAKA